MTTETTFDVTEIADEIIRSYAAENGQPEPDADTIEIIFSALERELLLRDWESVEELERMMRPALAVLLPVSLSVSGEPLDGDGSIEDALFAQDASPVFHSAIAQETADCLRGVLGAKQAEEVLEVFNVPVESSDDLLNMLMPVPSNFQFRPRWIAPTDRVEFERLVDSYQLTYGRARTYMDISASLNESFRRLAGSTTFAELLMRRGWRQYSGSLAAR